MIYLMFDWCVLNCDNFIDNNFYIIILLWYIILNGYMIVLIFLVIGIGIYVKLIIGVKLIGFVLID